MLGIDRPVFIVGSARSGTTLLRACLERSPRLFRLGRSSEYLFEREFPPLDRGRRAHVLDEHDATPEIGARLSAAFASECYLPDRPLTDADRRGWLDHVQAQGLSPYYYDAAPARLHDWFGASSVAGPPFPRKTGEIPPYTFPEPGVLADAGQRAAGLRLLDKDPAHVYRIRFLEALFPDARFIFLVRDGARAISSLIEAWRHPRWYFTYDMPVDLAIGGYSDVHAWGTRWWNLQLPPDWQDWTSEPLEAVCAYSWRCANEFLLRDAERICRRGAGMMVRYEDLIARPSDVLADVARIAGIPESDIVAAADALPAVPAAAPPSADKWRVNESLLRRVASLYAPVQERLGYAAF